MSDMPSISIGSVSGGQNNIGKTEIAGDQNQTNNYGQQPATAVALFSKIEESLQDLPEGDRQELLTEVVHPLRDLAMEAETKDSPATLMERASGLLTRLATYAPRIQPVVLAFGRASLKALASSNPVVAGVLAAIEEVGPQEANA